MQPVPNHPHPAGISILGIAGSVRHASYNRLALCAARRLAPAGAFIDICELAGLPMSPRGGGEQSATWLADLKARVRTADAILFAVPEYEHSITRVLDQIIALVAHSPGGNAWHGKPVALLGATAGSYESAQAQDQLRAALPGLGMVPVQHPEVLICKADHAFDRNGDLKSRTQRDGILELLGNLVHVVRRRRVEAAVAF